MRRAVIVLVLCAVWCGCGGRSRPLCEPSAILMEDKGDSGPGRRCR